MHNHPTGSAHHHEHGHAHSQAPNIVTADGATVPQGERIAPGALWERSPVDMPHQLWIDATEGAAGDMLLAALIDAGADGHSVARVLEIVAPGQLHIQRRRVQRGPFTALKIDVIADEPNPPARHLSDIEHMLATPGIPRQTRELALATFRKLAQAEADVHGESIESVHFHEVGALDSIGDIVGVCEALRTLCVDYATSSVVAVGAGTIRTQHGTLTVPPPAVAQLACGWQIEAGGPDDVGELCTPTGMALIRTACESVASVPPMTMTAVGVGAGTRKRSDRAGVLRVMLGTVTAEDATTLDSETVSASQVSSRDVVQVEANVDDLDPRLWPAVIDRLLDAGALDAWLTPIVMKKGRPAHIMSALTHPAQVEAVTDALLTHTSTIGVRVSAPAHRRILHREWHTVYVEDHPVRIKVSGDGPGTPIQQATAEFTDVEQLANRLNSPQRVALARAQVTAWESGLFPGADWPAESDNLEDEK
ncbi:MAG: nickel pincer cofactor biosynthesis protein LarC [Actinomycetaceae bacterium]|nr:nickel pincer cofactor biosynthesis protein LarC [Actinomycetaceae bacterium]